MTFFWILIDRNEKCATNLILQLCQLFIVMDNNYWLDWKPCIKYLYELKAWQITMVIFI